MTLEQKVAVIVQVVCDDGAPPIAVEAVGIVAREMFSIAESLREIAAALKKEGAA